MTFSGSKNHLKKHTEKDHRPEFDYTNPYNEYPRARPWSTALGNVTVCQNCDDVIEWDGTEWLHQFDQMSNCAWMVEE